MSPIALKYKITSLSPTEDLLTLGRYFSEVGAYSSTILSQDSLAFASKCEEKLRKIVKELKKRKVISHDDDLFESNGSINTEALKETNGIKNLSISDLELLYRQVTEPGLLDTKTRIDLQSKIVTELTTRNATTESDQLKIAYCVDTFQNELDYLSFLNGNNFP